MTRRDVSWALVTTAMLVPFNAAVTPCLVLAGRTRGWTGQGGDLSALDLGGGAASKSTPEGCDLGGCVERRDAPPKFAGWRSCCQLVQLAAGGHQLSEVRASNQPLAN